jgi:hypothetical protein
MIILTLTNIIDTNSLISPLCSGIVLPLIYFVNPLTESLQQDLHELEISKQNNIP